MAKVTQTTKLRDPNGRIVTLRKDEECPDWALNGVANDAPAKDEAWVIVNGDMRLGTNSRWVTGKGKPVTFASPEEAQARLEEVIAEHPDANIQKV